MNESQILSRSTYQNECYEGTKNECYQQLEYEKTSKKWGHLSNFYVSFLRYGG